jgi:hypothetical protein
MDMTSVNLQGFYPLAILHLGFAQFTFWPLLLALPFALWAFLKLPRFSLDEVKTSPHKFLLSVSVWVLLGFLASPLPWQYTYSIIWILIPLAWVYASSLERKFLIGISLFLGLTPQAIIGKSNSMWLEQHQSIFGTILILWIILMKQSQREFKTIKKIDSN